VPDRVARADTLRRRCAAGRNALAGCGAQAIGGPAPCWSQNAPCSRTLRHAGTGALSFAALLGVTYRMTTAPGSRGQHGRADRGRGLVAAPEPEREASTGLIGAPAAEQERIRGQGIFSRGRRRPRRPRGNRRESCRRGRNPNGCRCPSGFWITLGVGIALIALIYWLWSWERLEVFKMLLTSFFPLALMILAVLGFDRVRAGNALRGGGNRRVRRIILAGVYRFIAYWREGKSGGKDTGKAVWSTVKELGVIVKESSFLTAKTSAMVCWLFVGSGIFSAAFALARRAGGHREIGCCRST